MRQSAAKQIALGGILAALAVVIMCLGGLIPSATFVCPMMCCLLVQLVRRLCGSRIAWAWYGAVAILSLLMGPDKEAAAVFIFFGYYPMIKPAFDKSHLRWLWKLLYFNVVILLMYGLLIYVFNMADLAGECEELGIVLTLVMLILGNVTFYLVDKVLSRGVKRR